MVAQNGWHVYQLNVKSTSFNGQLKEDIYFEQPKSFEKLVEEWKVYKLQEASYGLNQALRAWYSISNSHLLNIGFKGRPNEATLYVKKNAADLPVASVYVNDVLVIDNSIDEVEEFKARQKME